MILLAHKNLYNGFFQSHLQIDHYLASCSIDDEYFQLAHKPLQHFPLNSLFLIWNQRLNKYSMLFHDVL